MAAPPTSSAATAAAGGRGVKSAASYSNKGYLYGPWLGTSTVTVNNYPRSVGLPIMGNPVAFFQGITGSRLGRGAPPVAAAGPTPTVQSTIAGWRKLIGV